MELTTHPAQAALWSASQRRNARRIAFVPTMGALHEGHLALVRHAREHADTVVASIFVNPLQFNDKKDLERYPRHPEEDRRMLGEVGCDMVFSPVAEELFHDFKPVEYDLNGLDGILEGASRPGHFQGVVNVVERLFHYVRPDLALFGEKDRQQLAVIRHVTDRLRWPVEIIGHPIVRAEDGLALSSRNQRLSAEEREMAPVLYSVLRAVQDAAFKLPVAEAVQAGLHVLAERPSVRLDYLQVAHPDSLQPLTNWDEVSEAAALIAAQVGPVRLIDNITLRR
ncbi:MAG: pantoate--beta-alanine ligase [Flavobacteriales bacterium]|nr:pantoate--beta-alanine ligase [Flavobacteriales bacterium]